MDVIYESIEGGMMERIRQPSSPVVDSSHGGVLYYVFIVKGFQIDDPENCEYGNEVDEGSVGIFMQTEISNW